MLVLYVRIQHLVLFIGIDFARRISGFCGTVQ